MTSPKTKYQIGTGLLFLGIAILIVQLLGMTGVTRKLAPSRDLSLTVIVIVVAAGALRRRARKDLKESPETK